MNNPHVATSEIVSYVENMIAIPRVLAFLDTSALYVLHDLILKGRKHYYLIHPEFLLGFQAGYEGGLADAQDYDLDAITFGMIIGEIEGNLSHARHEKDLRRARYMGWPLVHHSENVGFVFGWLSALFDHGFVFRLPRTPAELQRRSLASLLPSCSDYTLQEVMA